MQKATQSTYSLAPFLLDCVSREEIREYFLNGSELYETLFDSLKDEASYYKSPDPLRRPLLFYYGHTAVFYVNKLYKANVIKERINPKFEILFETGVDEMTWDDELKERVDWPPVDAVREYRLKVCEKVLEVIESAPLDSPITRGDPLWPVVMGCEHERIHLETSSVLIRQLSINDVQTPMGWQSSSSSGAFLQNPMVEIPAAPVTLGKPKELLTYGWDNEYGQERVDVDAFSISQYKVTNGEFLGFVQDGGYEDQTLWSDEGWQWRSFKQANHPLFWVPTATDIRQTRSGSTFLLRAVFTEREMPWDWPVEVNYYEARAFCKWKGPEYGLISEAQWHRLQGEGATAIPREDELANIGLSHRSPSSVDCYPPNELGVFDARGNVWEWTDTDFLPFSGFAVDPLYPDFSTPCFDYKHSLMMGGSWISTGAETSLYARYAFRRHFFQHAGFRLARNLPDLKGGYEEEEIAFSYLDMHYGSQENAPREAKRFCDRCADLIFKHSSGRERALDLGCAVGGTVFALAEEIQQVVGVDYSSRFISVANEIKERGAISYSIKQEGERREEQKAVITNPKSRERAEFFRGDALCLPDSLGEFDSVVMANLLCRLSDPVAMLQTLSSLLRQGGVVLITTPFTWEERYTPSNKWIGGKQSGFDSCRALKAIMQENFELLEESPLPFALREHNRRYQYVIPLATVWRKR